MKKETLRASPFSISLVPQSYTFPCMLSGFRRFRLPPKKSFPTEGISWQKPNRIRTRGRKPRLTYIEIPEGEDTLEHGSIYNCLSLRSETACSDSRSRSARNFHPGTRAGHLHKRHSGQARRARRFRLNRRLSASRRHSRKQARPERRTNGQEGSAGLYSATPKQL